MAVDLSLLRILVVDDEEAITKLMRMLLADFGINRVTIAKSGAEARHYLQLSSGKVDLIICDWNMPELTGLDLLKWIRKSDPDVPFIILTSRRDLESVKTARDHGVSDYLLKPFTAEQLLNKLNLHAAKAPA